MVEKVKYLNQMLEYNIVTSKLEENIVFQNIENFYNLAKKLRILLNEFNKNIQLIIDVDFVEKVTIFEMIEIIKKFYKEYNIEINLDTLINRGIIDFNLTNTCEEDFELWGLVHLENNIKLIDFNNNGLIIDVPVFVHELGHYRNLNKQKITQENDLLTESLARCDELLITDYLGKNGYEEQMNNYRISLLKQANKTIYYKEVFFKTLFLYKTLGDVSIKSYELLFKNTKDYEQVINNAYKIFKKNKNYQLIQPASYLLDTYISNYLFFKYKGNIEYLKIINELNEKIKTNSLEECLNFIGLKNLGANSQEMMLDAVKEMIDSITLEQSKTK